MISTENEGALLLETGHTAVIAEIGVNHDGSVDRALDLVSIAADCGADAVKLQIFRAEELMHDSSKFAEYQRISCAEDGTPLAMLQRFELSDAELAAVVAEIRRFDMVPLATPFSPADVARIEVLDLPAIKIASPDLVNWPLLRCAAETGCPMLVSTGAAQLNEVASAVAWLRGWDVQFTLLHCISAYPTPAWAANLSWIAELESKFSVPVGFSDHTTELAAGALAVAAGACIVEKHLTYDCGAPGPDHAASFDPGQFEEYVRLIRLAERMRGCPGKRVLEIERDVRSVSRQSIVAARDIPRGSFIREEDLTVKRPGTGIPASAMPSLVGRRVGTPIQSGQMLTWQTIADAA